MLRNVDWRHIKNLACWAIIHFTHWGFYVGTHIATIFIVVNDPWYHVLPWLLILPSPLLGGVNCAYNNAENRYRLALGWPLIEHNFIPTAINDFRYLMTILRRK